MTFQHLY